MAQQLERRLVTEYLWAKYKQMPQWKNARLGPLPTTAMASLYKVTLRWADAIVYDGQAIIIIEAKMRPAPGACGQLELYKQLLPKTPEFSQYAKLDIKLVLLTTLEDRMTRQFCQDKDIDYVIFSPAWVQDYWKATLNK